MPSEGYQNLCKKNIFVLLSRPVPYDYGNKDYEEVWLDRITRKVCMSISEKAMAITRIDDRRHWNYNPTEESRLHLGRSSRRLGRRVCNYKRGCWVNYKVGEFVASGTEPTTEVTLSNKLVDCTHSKVGLCVDSVSIIPSHLKERKRKCILKQSRI